MQDPVWLCVKKKKKKKQPVPAENPVASVNTWRIEQNHDALIQKTFFSPKRSYFLSFFFFVLFLNSGQMLHAKIFMQVLWLIFRDIFLVQPEKFFMFVKVVKVQKLLHLALVLCSPL